MSWSTMPGSLYWVEPPGGVFWLGGAGGCGLLLGLLIFLDLDFGALDDVVGEGGGDELAGLEAGDDLGLGAEVAADDDGGEADLAVGDDGDGGAVVADGDGVAGDDDGAGGRGGVGGVAGGGLRLGGEGDDGVHAGEEMAGVVIDLDFCEEGAGVLVEAAEVRVTRP